MVQAADTQTSSIQEKAKTKQIVLAGNPNVGKSALFSALTGLHAEISNYPGTTIDISRGKLAKDDLADTPGIYGVSSFNDEERIARKMILAADLIINVVSALSLDRDLFLTLQLIDMGKPLILVVNQWDEAHERGMKIDFEKLEKLLGVPVVKTVAIKNEGTEELLNRVKDAKEGHVSKLVLQQIRGLLEAGIPQNSSLLIAEGDQPSAEEHGKEPASASERAELYRERRQRVNELVNNVVTQVERKKQLSVFVGRLLLDPLWGGLISCFVCYLIFYQLLGVLVAGKVVDITEKQIMRVYCEPAVRKITAALCPTELTLDGKVFDFPNGTMNAPSAMRIESSASDSATSAAPSASPAQIQSTNVSSSDPQVIMSAFTAAQAKVPGQDVQYDFWKFKTPMGAIGNILAGEYGILTLTVTYLIGLLLPLVMAFYFGLSLLEDSGYLPRLAVLVDRLLNKLGLTGRAVIPLILGLGCVTMATVTTRLLSSRREKIIATALLGIAIPCSAQLGIVSGTLAKAGGLMPWIVYGFMVGGILVGTGLLLNKIMPGKSTSLMIDLPPMRLPRAGNVLKKTWTKSYNFMIESIPMFCIAGLVVSLGQMTGLLNLLIQTLSPLTVGWLRLPDDPRIPTTFILGIVRRDFAAFGLTDVALTQAQAVVAMVVITLFVPCIATVGVMIKERGPKIAFSIWIGSWLFAFLIGGLLALVLPKLFALLPG